MPGQNIVIPYPEGPERDAWGLGVDTAQIELEILGALLSRDEVTQALAEAQAMEAREDLSAFNQGYWSGRTWALTELDADWDGVKIIWSQA